jgi:3-hydroxybutyryl-CoA dehydratase
MICIEKIHITKELVINFSKVSGDENPIHLDEDYSKNTIFKKPIAHGMLLASFFSKIISEVYPGHGSIYLSQTLNFLKPCFVGEEINVKITLISEHNGKYKLNTQILNNDNVILIDGEALILKR